MATLLVSCLVPAFLLLVLNAAALGSDLCLDGEMVAAQGDQLLQKESSLRFASAPAQPVAGDQDHRTDDKEHATLPFSLLAASLVSNYSALDSTAKTVGAEAALPVSLLASSLDSAPSSKKSSGFKAAPGKKSAEKSVARKAASSKAQASKAAPAKKSAEKSVAHKAATSKAKAAPAKKSAEKSVAHKAAASKATASKGVASKAAPGKKSAEKSVANKAAVSKATASKGVASKGTKKTKAKQEETVDSSSENEVLETNFKKGKKFVSTGATRQHAEPAASKTKRSNAPAHARGAEKGAAHAKGVAKADATAKAKKAKKLTLTKTSKLHGKIKAASVTGKKSKKSKAEAAEDLEDEAEEDLEDEAKDATTGTLFNPVIGSVVVLMSAPAGMLLLSFGAFLWVRSQDDVEMGA